MLLQPDICQRLGKTLAPQLSLQVFGLLRKTYKERLELARVSLLIFLLPVYIWIEPSHIPSWEDKTPSLQTLHIEVGILQLSELLELWLWENGRLVVF